MLRVLHVLSILFLVGAAVAVYKLKYESTYDAQRVAKLRNEIRVERERLSTLKAEWSRLASPQRIQDLAARHLGMKPLEVARISDFSNLPERAPGSDGDPIGEFIDTLAETDVQRDPLGDLLRSLNGEATRGAR
jgi:cell division protein FtsL